MLRPDLDAIRISTLSDASSYSPVCVTRFACGVHRLFYINARHVTNADNATCRTIDQAFKEFRPKSVVVECGGGAAGPRFSDYAAQVLDRVKEPSNATTECDFSILKALRLGLPLTNGEPTDRSIFDALLKQGYSPKEFQAFLHLRWVANTVKRQKIDTSLFERKSDEILGYVAESLSIPTKERLSYNEYQEWFSRHYPDRKGFLDVSTNDAAPDISSSATFAQKLCYEISRVREPHIVETITQVLNRHETTLVVYGAGHRESHLPVFKKMMGPHEMHILAPEQPKATDRTKQFPRPLVK